MWVLIGYGPNDVAIPALVWIGKDDALAACKEIFGRDPDGTSGAGFLKVFRWQADAAELEKSQLAKMYTSYYGGCGECYLAKLRYVEEGKPFVCFNLD